MKRVLSILLAVIMLLTSIPLMGLDSIFVPKAEATASMKDIVASKSVGDTVTFGSYPQTDVTSSMRSVLTAAAPSIDNWNSYGYYIESVQSDYMKYYDLAYNGSRYRGVYFTKYRPYYWNYSSSLGNTYQDNNGYYTSTVYWFKYEPLTWRVLDPATGYVMCETIIDSQAFNNEYYTNGTKDPYGNTAYYSDKTYQHYANNWEYSTIRQWLNDTFYNTAFTSSERSQIPCTKLTTPAYDSYRSAYDVGETHDYIFLPSSQDMRKTSYGFSSSNGSDIDRRAHASDYAKSQGIMVITFSSDKDKDGEYTSYYRLRTAGISTQCVTHVDSRGDLFCEGWGPCDTYFGIRPALCFKLNDIEYNAVYDSDYYYNGDGFFSNVAQISNAVDIYLSFENRISDKLKNKYNKDDLLDAKTEELKSLAVGEFTVTATVSGDDLSFSQDSYLNTYSKKFDSIPAGTIVDDILMLYPYELNVSSNKKAYTVNLKIQSDDFETIEDTITFSVSDLVSKSANEHIDYLESKAGSPYRVSLHNALGLSMVELNDMNNTILNDFLTFKSNKKDLISTYGDDLYNVDVTPVTVKASNVILAIDKYTTNEIDTPMLLDWVNVIWFTDLYEYVDNESDSISSVLDVLETLDEEGVVLTEDDFIDMKRALLSNQEYVMTAK